MELIRGDTVKYKFRRKNNEGKVIAFKADEIYFTVKENGYTDKILIKKRLEDTFDKDYYYHLTINPEDTDDLDYGTYRFDIEVIQDGAKTTVIIDKFIVSEEITFASDEDSVISL